MLAVSSNLGKTSRFTLRFTLTWPQVFLNTDIGSFIWIVRSATKTDAGERALPLGPESQEILERRLREKDQSVDWVFPAKTKFSHTNKDRCKNQHRKAVLLSGSSSFLIEGSFLIASGAQH